MLTFALAAALGAPLPPVLTARDVEPIFAEGPAAKAVVALAEGRFDEAAAGLARVRQPEARWLEALALVGAGRFDEAAAALAGLDARLPDLAERIHFLRGQALERAGRRGDAAEAYGAVGPGSLVRPEALLARARILAALGDTPGALEALQPLLGLTAPDDLSRPDAAAEALLLAAGLRAAGPGRDPAAARADLVQCWAGHPLAPAAPRCREALRALPAPHREPPAFADALRRAEALLDANRNRAAIAELEPLAAGLPPPSAGSLESCRVRMTLGRAYRKERRYRQALDVLGPALAACPEMPVRLKALHAQATSAAAVAPDEAIERYRQIAREYPDSPLADDALYFAADLLARGGRIREAREALAQIAERYPVGDYRAEALFRLAWLAFRGGDAAAALEVLERVQREYAESDPYEFSRAAYWRARILKARGRKGDAARARELWAMLVARQPADYYGLLARARLAELGRGSAPPWKRPEGGQSRFRYDPGGLPGDPHFRAGLLLLRLGQDRPAAEELRAVDRSLLVPADPAGAGPLLLTAELLHRAGDHRAAHNLVRTLGRQALRHGPNGPALRVWRIAYPPAWRDEVERWAPPAGVPTDLLQAIMREESALDPGAISAAGAVGLTQLMLPTAKAEARRAGIGRTLAAADLMDGALNIRLGAGHLGTLLRRFGGSAPLAVAAYNAGEALVRSWVRSHGELPLDEFVEEMPLQETRGYVKRVLRSYAAYRLLYGGPGETPVALSQKLPQPR